MAMMHVLQMSADNDNFKAYVGVFKDIADRSAKWKSFYEEPSHKIYTVEKQLKLPIAKYDPKQSNLTYTEIINILYIFRPYELATYLYYLPLSNQFPYSAKPCQPSYPRNGRLSLITTSEPLIFTGLGFIEGAVHSFSSVSLDDLEKIAGEGKILILYKASRWPVIQLKEFLSKAKALSLQYSKFRLWVVEEGSFFYKDLMSVFDYFLNSDVGCSIKELCTYFLSVQTGWLINTYSIPPVVPAEIYESLEKINYDYSKETKIKSSMSSEFPTRIGYSRQSIIELSISVDLIKCLNDQTNNKAISSLDENRTILTTYLLMSIAIKNIKKCRENYGLGFYLSAFDIAAQVQFLIKILEVLPDCTSKSYLLALDQLFFYDGSASTILQPFCSFPRLSEYFKLKLKTLYEGTSVSLTVENESYSFSTKAFKKNNQELLASICSFPSFDPPEISQLSRRDMHINSKQQSSGIFSLFRSLSNSGQLTIGFRDDLRICDTNGKEISTQTSDDEMLALTWTIYFKKKISMLMILNLLGSLPLPNMTKSALMAGLINLKQEARELQSDYGENEEERERARKEKKNRHSKRNTVKIATGSSRKSIVENMRNETQKQLAVSTNSTRRASFIKEMDKEFVVPKGLKVPSNLMSSPLPKTKAGKSKNKKVEGKAGIMERGARFSLSNSFGKSTTNKIYSTDLSCIELKPATEKTKKELLRRARVCQSQAWQELILTRKFHKNLTQIMVHKFEVFSGEIYPFYNENENSILAEVEQTEKLGYKINYDQDCLQKIFSNKVPTWMKLSIPVNLQSTKFDSTFSNFWTNINKRFSYTQHLSASEDAFPVNGSYDLSRLFAPISLLINFAFLFCLKSKVAFGL